MLLSVLYQRTVAKRYGMLFWMDLNRECTLVNPDTNFLEVAIWPTVSLLPKQKVLLTQMTLPRGSDVSSCTIFHTSI